MKRGPYTIAVLALAAAVGCEKPDSVVLVSITSEPDVPPLVRLRVTTSHAANADVRLFPAAAAQTPIAYPATFALVIPHARVGRFDIAVEGLDAAMTARAAAALQLKVTAGGRGTMDAVLTTRGLLCGNGRLDADEQCDDANRLSGDGCDIVCRIPQVPADAGTGLDASDASPSNADR